MKSLKIMNSMEKDFDKWNEFKKDLENITHNVIIKEGEIWWCTIGLNIKTETCGKGKEFRRPVLVLKKLSLESCIIIPLSTKFKSGTWYANYVINDIKYTALLYQIRMIHTNRLTKFEFKLDQLQFLEIKKRLKFLLNL